MTKGKDNDRVRVAVVAGGAGFVGSHLCDFLLEQGARVICVDSLLTGSRANVAPLDNHPRFCFLRHDVCEPLSLDGPVDEIYNLACAASPPRYQADPAHTMLTCVVGTANLLRLASVKHASFLMASTSEVYGDPDEHPQAETYRGNVNCTGPRACYDEGKRAAEALCFDHLRAGAADVRVARIFNTYGPRMDRDDGRIVSNFVTQALEGRPLTIYGSGEQTRSFCYVSDLVAGLVALMRVEPNPGRPVNLGNPGEFTVREMAAMAIAMTGSDSRIETRPLPQDDPRRRRPDIALARELLGWTPRIALEEGLRRTIDWFAAAGAPRPSAGPASARAAGARHELHHSA